MNQTKVLIIEDNRLSALKIKKLLKSSGFEVCGIVSNASDAMEIIKLCRVDGIIIDMETKFKLNGIEIVSFIHKTENIPTIVVTKHHNYQILKEASKIHFIGYIVKPYLDSQLLKEVKLISIRLGLITPPPSNDIIDIGNNYHYSRYEKKLYHSNIHVKLTKQELSLVEILVQNIGQIVTLETIEFILWHDKAVTDGSRRQLLFRLKSKMQGVTIEVIKGVGYKLHKQ